MKNEKEDEPSKFWYTVSGRGDYIRALSLGLLQVLIFGESSYL